MNRYSVEGICRDLASGKSVILVAPTLSAARQGFSEVETELQGIAEVRRVYGNEKITHQSGGTLTTASPRASGRLRGMCPAVVYIDEIRALPLAAQSDLFAAIDPRAEFIHG